MFLSGRDKDFYWPLLTWLIVVCWYFVFLYGFFSDARFKAQDFFISQAFNFLSQPPPAADKIVIVAIDEVSRKKLNYKWPWPRSVTAKLVQNIVKRSPKVIGLDIIFSGKSREKDDKKLILALSLSPNIVLSYRLKPRSLDLPWKGFITAVHNSIGFINKPADADGVLRKTRNFYIDTAGRVKFSLEIEVLRGYLGISRDRIRAIYRKGVFLDKKLLFASPLGISPLNYLVYPREFTTIPAYAVLSGKISPGVFKDKIVLIGATDPLIHDEQLTPLGVFPGVTIIANSLVMMLSRRFIYNVPAALNILIIIILGALIILINKRVKFSLYSFFIFVSLGAALFTIFIILRAKGIQFDYFSIFFITGCAYIISMVIRYSSLVYTSNRLKNLAIKDPLSGFYTCRYFLLKLDEQLKHHSGKLSFIVLVIRNYSRLILDLNFEGLKSLLRQLSEYILDNAPKSLGKIEFIRVSQEAIGFLVWGKGKNKDKIESFLQDILREVNNMKFNIEGNPVNISLRGIFIYKATRKRISVQELMSAVESLLKKISASEADSFISFDLAAAKRAVKKDSYQEDILDFLVRDVEEKNKDLRRIVEELSAARKESEAAYFEVMLSLIKALEERDIFTQGHSERVARYAKGIAQEAGLGEEETELIYNAALLHDIGKIGIPDSILHKKTMLSGEEINFIRKHEIISVEILKPIKAFNNLLPIILHHHEFFDGTGYPYGLSGDMIPRGAQILAVADSFEAMTSGRGYKKGKSVREAIDELEKYKGIQFNPLYVDALRKFLSL